MAHDGFMGAFHHDLPWPLAQHAAGSPFDALQVQVPHAFAGAGVAWEHDAAVSSLVSSPASAVGGGGGEGGAGEAALMEQLASRLGVGAPSPSSRYASCYSTPVGSPSKPMAPLFQADGSPVQAARLSCFAGSGGKLSRVASSQSLLGSPAPSPSPGGAANLHGSDGSSSDGPRRKRKAPAGGKSKAKDAVTMATAKSPEAERRSKKSKLSADAGEDDDDELRPASGDGKGKEVVIAEAPKDYIHVRARRGQATDSHSLAERVRREQISERMKLLQDIVPGCSKVTGKAVMLDEIINYVQSLQRQVEFLSMKLSTVNPRLEVDVDSLVQKDADQSCLPAASSLPPAVYSLEGSSSAFCYASSPAVQSAVTNAKSFEAPSSFVNHGIPDHSLEGFQNANPQIGSLWEDDLQSLVQMGFRGNT